MYPNRYLKRIQLFHRYVKKKFTTIFLVCRKKVFWIVCLKLVRYHRSLSFTSGKGKILLKMNSILMRFLLVYKVIYNFFNDFKNIYNVSCFWIHGQLFNLLKRNWELPPNCYSIDSLPKNYVFKILVWNLKNSFVEKRRI